MHPTKPLAPLQQLASLALATLMTGLLLASLAAQADTQHAHALAQASSAHNHSQLLCATPQRASRS